VTSFSKRIADQFEADTPSFISQFHLRKASISCAFEHTLHIIKKRKKRIRTRNCDGGEDIRTEGYNIKH
jgi:hypothetical protein